MKFKEILNRITGFSFPIFGVSWNPPELEVTKARRVITFLEDRRVLFYPRHAESFDYATQSVLEIRHFLTEEISSLSTDSELTQSLRAMRAACRKFLDATDVRNERDRSYRRFPYSSSDDYFTALGELRATFGILLASIAAKYGLDIEDALAELLPAKEESNKSLKPTANQQDHSTMKSPKANLQGSKKKQIKRTNKKVSKKI
jgi:hypothetical protein